MLRIYRLEAWYELLKTVRMPAYAIPTIAFPLMFYVLFGLAFGAGRVTGSVTMSAYLIASYGAVGVIGASLFAFGVGVATERGQGWMTVKRASPMPLPAYFFGKIAVSMAFSLAVVLLLFALGAAAGGVRMPWGSWLLLAAVLVFGTLPFCALGLAIGYAAGPNSAPGFVNLIFLPMCFASGLWIPYEFLPKVVRAVAPFLPAYHLARLALRPLGAGGTEPVVFHLAALAGFSVVFLALAALGFRRDEGKMYG